MLKLIFVVFYTFVSCIAAYSAMAENTVTWREVVTQDNQRIGYGNTEISEGAGIRKVYDSLTISTRQQNLNKVKVHLSTEYVEDDSGTPLYVIERSHVGKLKTKREARIQLPKVTVKSSNFRNDQDNVVVTVPEGTRFDEGDGLIETWDFNQTPKLEFLSFNISTQKVEPVVIEREGGEILSDKSFWATRTVMNNNDVRQKTRIRLDQNNRVIERIADIAGTAITIRNTDRETALSGSKAYNVIQDQSIKSPYLLSKKSLRSHIRYTFSHIDGEEIVIPGTGEQQVTYQDNNVIVDICATCGDNVEVSEEELQQALSATQWLQTDHPEILKLVNGIADSDMNDDQKMKKFVKVVNKKLKDVEFVGHATAVEALTTQRGDCTEFAVLLATLARAVGIPARVISGLAYSRESFHGVSNVFIPHAWVQIWTEEKWKSYDASLKYFDSSHIALTVSDGEPAAFIAASQLASKLKWEGLAKIEKKR